MSVIIKQTDEIISREIFEKIQSHFLLKDIQLINKKRKWFGDKTEIRTGIIAKIFHIQYKYIVHGIVTNIDLENKNIEIYSYNKRFLRMCTTLNEKIPEYDIIVTELFE